MNEPLAPAGWWRPADVRSRVDVTDGLQHGGNVAFWALVVFTLVLVLAPQDHVPALKSLHLAFVAGGVAGLAYVWARLSGRVEAPYRSPEVTLAALLLLLAVATVPFSLWPGGSIAAITGIFVKALVIFWLLGRVIDSVPRLRTMAWTLSLASLPLSLSAIATFMGAGFHANADIARGLERISGYTGGLTGNPNDLALMVNITIPFTVALLLTVRRFPVRLALVALLVTDVAAVVATYSRTGFLTLVTIVISYLVCLPRRTRGAVLAAVAVLGLAGLAVVPNSYVHRLSTITRPAADWTGSAEQRLGDMARATRFVAGHPIIGAGAGLDAVALRQVGSRDWKKVHNVYLEYAVELGLPGLALFLALYYQALKSARYGRRLSASDRGDGGFHRLSEATLIALVAFGVSAMFHPSALQFYFYYLAGLAVAVRGIAHARYAPAPREAAG